MALKPPGRDGPFMGERRSAEGPKGVPTQFRRGPARSAALYDSETGLASKALFRDRTEHALSRAGRTQARVALVVLEVPPETPPQAAGRAVFDALLRQLRPQDTVAVLDDNFIGVLVEDVPGTAVAQKIRARLADALPACRGSSVAVSDSRGRIGFWMAGAA